MPRALRGVVGLVLVLAVVGPTPKASAQILPLFRRQQTPGQKDRYEIDAILSDEHQRLAEMKVEMALLSEIATFPYDFAARANGKTLELHGSVPNEMVRQRAMELARSNTFLRGIDGLRVQPNLSVRSTLRPSIIVQQEGMELLFTECAESAKHMALDVRPNGVAVLKGYIDCVESKLVISRLFRRLPGCTAIINELKIEPIMLNGQRMVRVTRNNMLLVRPSALGQEVEARPEPTAAGGPDKKMLPPVERQPAPQRASNLNADEVELHLPGIPTAQQPNKSTRTASEKDGSDSEAFAPSKLPVKWGRPSESWDVKAKELETANTPSTASASKTGSQQATPQPLPKPAKLVWTPQSSARPQDDLPIPIRMVDRSVETKKGQTSATATKQDRTSTSARPNFADGREASDQAMTWHRPGGSEESEPKSAVSTKQEPDDSAKLPTPPPALPARSSRRWPPAYVSGTPPSNGRTGVVSFDDDPPPAKPAKPEPVVIATSRSLAPADLQRQIKSLCGRQAHEVVAIAQKDGTVLIRVKVANRSIEDQLSRKILALPEMTSPKVRLMIEIEP